MKVYKVYEGLTGEEFYFSTKALAKAFEQTLINDDAEPSNVETIDLDLSSIEVPSGRKAKLKNKYWLDPIPSAEEEIEYEKQRNVGDTHIFRHTGNGKLYRIYEVKPQMKTGGKYFEAEPYPAGIDNGQVKIKKLKNLEDFEVVARR